ncbi:nucleolar protein 9 isoform X2 [Prorops nasuta]
MSSDSTASHVLRTIIVVCAERGNTFVKSDKASLTGSSTETNIKQFVEVKESEVKAYNDIALKLCKYFLNNIEEFIWDIYANHLLRTAICCLGGLFDKLDEKNKEKSLLQKVQRHPVLEEYTELLKSCTNRLLNWPRFPEFVEQELTSALLQILLYTLKGVSKQLTSKLIKKIRKDCFKSEEETTIPAIFNKTSGVRLLEACILTAKPKAYSSIYKHYFSGKINVLCTKQETHFSVQKLLDCCEEKEQFEQIFDEVSAAFEDILEKRFTDMLVSTANACLRLQSKQGPFVSAVMKMLHCDSTQEKQLMIVPCVVVLKKLEELESLKTEAKNIPINMHGSLIVQAMLNFNKPIKIINSILSLGKEELLHLLCDTKGSHITDAYVDSTWVGEKSREKLLKKLSGCWAMLAQSTHGSRSLDKLWKCSQSKQRIIIMDELAAIGESLRSTQSGSIIYAKLNVSLFARNKKDWMESQGKEEKTKALFADILEKPVKVKNK